MKHLIEESELKESEINALIEKIHCDNVTIGEIYKIKQLLRLSNGKICELLET